MSFEMAKSDKSKVKFLLVFDFSLIIDVTTVNKINNKFVLKHCIYVC